MAVVKQPGLGCTVSAQPKLAAQCELPPTIRAVFVSHSSKSSSSLFTPVPRTTSPFTSTLRSTSPFTPTLRSTSLFTPTHLPLSRSRALGKDKFHAASLSSSGRNASPTGRGKGYVRATWGEEPFEKCGVVSTGGRNASPAFRGEGYVSGSKWEEGPWQENGAASDSSAASERLASKTSDIEFTEAARIETARTSSGVRNRSANERGLGDRRGVSSPNRFQNPGGKTPFSSWGVVSGANGRGVAGPAANIGVSPSKSQGYKTPSPQNPARVKQTLSPPGGENLARRKWEEILPEEANPVKETQKALTEISEALVAAGQKDEPQKWEERFGGPVRAKSSSPPPPVLAPPPPPRIERTRLSEIIARESRAADLAEERRVLFQGGETDGESGGGLRFFTKPTDLPEVDPEAREEHIAQWLRQNGITNRKKEEDWFSQDGLPGMDELGLESRVNGKKGSRADLVTEGPRQLAQGSVQVTERQTGSRTGLRTGLSPAKQRAQENALEQRGFEVGSGQRVVRERGEQYAGERASNSGRDNDSWRGTPRNGNRQNDSWQDGRSNGQQRSNSWRGRPSNGDRESDSWQNQQGNGRQRSDSWRGRPGDGDRESDSWQNGQGNGQRQRDSWRGRPGDGGRGNDTWQNGHGNGQRRSDSWRSGQKRGQWESDSWRGLAEEVDGDADTGGQAGDADMNDRRGNRGGAYSHRVPTVEVDRESWLLGGPTPKPSQRKDDLAGYTVTGAGSLPNPGEQEPEDGVVEAASDLLGGREFVRVRLPRYNETPVDAADLHQSIMQRDFSRLWWLVEQRGVDVNQLDDRVLGFYTTALHIACEIGDAIMVKRLVSNGARANIPDEFGRFPLVSALIGKEGYLTKFAVIEALLETGVGLEQRNPLNGKYPMHYAVAGPDDVIVYLRDRGASLDVKDFEGRTPLHDSLDIRDTNDPAYRNMEYLLGMGAKANAADKKGRTPLHIAAERHEYVRCKELLRWKANVNARDNSGRTPMRYVRPQPYGEDSIISLFQRFYGHL